MWILHLLFAVYFCGILVHVSAGRRSGGQLAASLYEEYGAMINFFERRAESYSIANDDASRCLQDLINYDESHYGNIRNAEESVILKRRALIKRCESLARHCSHLEVQIRVFLDGMASVFLDYYDYLEVSLEKKRKRASRHGDIEQALLLRDSHEYILNLRRVIHTIYGHF